LRLLVSAAAPKISAVERLGAVKMNDLRETNLIHTTTATTLRCPACALALNPASFSGGAAVDCPACRSQLCAAFFPAFDQPPLTISTASGERALEGEAACFFHPEKRAALACDACGRFLCELCDLPLGARHVCPTCLASGAAPELVTHRTCWSQTALIVGFLPLLIGWIVWPFVIVSGLVAIFLALWAWNKPGSLVNGPRRWAAVAGLIGGLLQIGLIVGIGVLLWHTVTHG
jgi:hypothetical protein